MKKQIKFASIVGVEAETSLEVNRQTIYHFIYNCNVSD